MDEFNTIHDICPICGFTFYEIHDSQQCPTCGEIVLREQLITEDDDYLWCW